jgi:hypothetical protein
LNSVDAFSQPFLADLGTPGFLCSRRVVTVTFTKHPRSYAKGDDVTVTFVPGDPQAEEDFPPSDYISYPFESSNLCSSSLLRTEIFRIALKTQSNVS